MIYLNKQPIKIPQKKYAKIGKNQFADIGKKIKVSILLNAITQSVSSY